MTRTRMACAAVCSLILIARAQADPKVAYQESGEGFRVGVKIRILDLADGSVTQFTDDWLREAWPSWGPGGETLVAHGHRDSNDDIFRARVGGERTWLTNHPEGDITPAWSPDGGRIAFASTRDGGVQLFVMDADGGDLRRVTNDAFYSSTPSWSPDGRRLVYGYGDGWNFSALRILDLATGRSHDLTDRNGRRHAPHWSWDGEHVAYSVQDDALNEFHVEVVSVDRKDAWRLTEDAGPLNSGAAWTPDGDVSFTTQRGDRRHIAVTGLRGGDIELLTDSLTHQNSLAWYNPRYFAVRPLSVLQPKVWGWLKAR
ncbi:hypothetical protein CMK11_08125 [Candidatus Poribacteria bacterium]|nr:hypothetical protein [Candidatus Poribacteria bacterium]